MRWFWSFPALFLFFPSLWLGPSDHRERTLEGSGIGMVDAGIGRDGYRIYYPLDADSARVVVFLHGYGGYNPMYYGKWIRHLVTTGRTVIFPYYQDNFFTPSPDRFAIHAAGAVRDALSKLRTEEGLPHPFKHQLDYIGHSFGGAIASELAAGAASYGLPEPGTLFLAMAGTGPFRKGRRPDYSGIPETCVAAMVVGTRDYVVGEEFSRLVWRTASGVPRKIWMELDDRPGKPKLRGEHNVSCSRDAAFDNGVRNYNFARTILHGGEDAYDHFLWAAFDRLQQAAELGFWFREHELEVFRDLDTECLTDAHLGLFLYSSTVTPGKGSGG